MTGKLKLTLLGEPDVTLDNVPLTGFISTKAEALLYYLAVTGQPHSREVLAGLLWGEMPQSSARKNLTKALSNLRKMVGPHLILDHHSAGFNLQSSFWLDVSVFQESLQRTDAGIDLEVLRQAVDLYTDDFLKGFYVKDASLFGEWVLAEQERLRQLLIQALQRLAKQLKVGNDYATALDYVSRLLKLDPYREAAHRLMMTLLAGTGQRTAALAQYESCRQILAEELGAAPAAETQALYKRIVAGDTSIPHNLPHLITTFVGREVELSKIIALLNDPGCRLLTIAGPGGIGKTRLTLQAATHFIQQTAAFDLEGDFADGVYLVRLAPLDSTKTIIPVLAEALGFSFHKEGDPKRQLLNYLQQKTMLLVLDNFEHLLAPAQEGMEGGLLVTTILQSAPGVKILTTSRTRLNVQGEHIYYLTGMPFPDWKSPTGFGESLSVPLDIQSNADLVKTAVDYDAVQLFVDQARRVRPEFELTKENVTDVIQICRLVQGLPLGILLAAAWVEIITPTEIAAEIARSLDFLETEMSDVPQRQRSIRAVFDHSWNLLSDRERDIFQQLSIFRGHFSRQAAQLVTDASLRELMTLANKSFLRHTATGRYVVHGLLRQYAADMLEKSEDGGQASRNRHAAHFIAMLKQFAVDLKGPRQQAALAEFEVEAENLRVAWNWAIDQQRVEWLSQAMDGLGYFYTWRGRFQEGEAAFRRATEALQGSVSKEKEQVQAKLVAWQAVFSHQLGQTELAHQLLKKSLTLLENSALDYQDVRAKKAFILLQMGEIRRETDRQQARKSYEQSLAIYRALDDHWGTANALASLGWLIQHFGAYDEAKQLYSESLTLRQMLEDRWGIADSLILLGSIALYQGYPDEAEQLVRQSIALRQEVDDRAGIAHSLSKLGETLTRLGRFAEAHDPLAESKAIYDNLGSHNAAAFSEAMLASLMIHLGQYEASFQMAKRALAHFQKNNSRRGKGYSLLVMGWALLGNGKATEAQQVLQESLTIYQNIKQLDELAQTLTLLGYAAYQLDNPTQAQQHLIEGLDSAVQIQAFMPMMLALPAITLLLSHQNRLEEAIELYALASCYPFVANSQWFKQITGQHIETIANTLPSHIIKSAQKRGESKVLEKVVDELLNTTLIL